MTRQTEQPLENTTLNPTFQSTKVLSEEIGRGSLILSPPYQRDDVWTLDQRLALIEAWLRGRPTGVITLADRTNQGWVDANPGRDPYEMGHGMNACVDGKQRLTTAVTWYADEFAIPASWVAADWVAKTEDTDDGPYVRWSGFTRKGTLIFQNRCQLLVHSVRNCSTEAEEAAFYLMVNGGGTVQSAAAMANAARVAAS